MLAVETNRYNTNAKKNVYKNLQAYLSMLELENGLTQMNNKKLNSFSVLLCGWAWLKCYQLPTIGKIIPQYILPKFISGNRFEIMLSNVTYF